MRKKCIPIVDVQMRQLSCARFNSLVSIEDLNQLTVQQYSHNSLLSMTNDWNHFVEFCHNNNVVALPASTIAVRLFLDKQAKTKKYSTIKRTAISIGLVHRFHDHKDPCNHRQIKLNMAQTRLDKKGDARQAPSFDRQHLQILQQQLSSDSDLKTLRDVALVSVMFECALKRSELRALQFAQLQYKAPYYWIRFGEQTYQLSQASSDILGSWMLMIAEHSGPVFRRLDRHGNIGDMALDASSIYRVFRAIEQRLNVNTKFTGQSARVGAVKQLSAQGYHITDITEFGRWVSPAMPAQYLGKQVMADKERLRFKTIKPWD
ncbi:tyrosine-type recombinase/integrase [Vibrio gallicus]|uniref:tyrosine-type recombinase/integrase n=1 Tax=Vibrio gallicus TaxID=190897 RepID=UPI0021C376F1|nr:tyrosine-type recombinase/integrase [Vibrio gallicus]